MGATRRVRPRPSGKVAAVCALVTCPPEKYYPGVLRAYYITNRLRPWVRLSTAPETASRALCGTDGFLVRTPYKGM